MIKYLKKHLIWCVLAPLFMLGEISMDLLQPSLMAAIVDKGVFAQDMSFIISTGTKMILLVFFGGFCGIASGVFGQLAGQGFGNDLRKDLFRKIMMLSFQQTDKFSTGSLITRLGNDVTQVQTMVSMSVRSVVRVSVMFLGGIYMLYRQSSRFAYVVLCALPFVLVIILFFLKKASPLFGTVQKKLDNVNNVMQENVAGSRVVKAYVREKHELDRFDIANGELCAVNLRVQSLLAFLLPCLNMLLNLCVIGVILAGGNAVKHGGAVTAGEIMAALTYVAMILHSVMFMANIFQTFTRASASVARINEVIKTDSIIKDGDTDTQADCKGEVSFNNVSFSYPSAGAKVLDGITFTVKRGETLAIIGSTGCGKSSLVNLILRFYDAVSGNIFVDGRDVRSYTLEALRNKIAIVMQSQELYTRSVADNISWGKENASPSEIKEAAQLAQADDFICRMEQGYYTPVSEGGHSLSGGQKQRICVARAVLKKPEILIFDDATSALDLQTEAKLYKALNEKLPDCTKIIVAQRIASVRNADKIIVLEDGRITACGTHEELLKSSAVYRDICDSQTKGGGLNE